MSVNFKRTTYTPVYPNSFIDLEPLLKLEHIDGPDEFVALARAFNTLALELKRTQQYIGISGVSWNPGDPTIESLVSIASGPAGSKGATGSTGPTGATGARGATWHVGSGVPAGALGSNDDLYLNTVNNDYYVKSGGAWGTASGNLTGATGAAGADGQSAFVEMVLEATTSNSSGDVVVAEELTNKFSPAGWHQVINLTSGENNPLSGGAGPYSGKGINLLGSSSFDLSAETWLSVEDGDAADEGFALIAILIKPDLTNNSGGTAAVISTSLQKITKNQPTFFRVQGHFNCDAIGGFVAHQASLFIYSNVTVIMGQNTGGTITVPAHTEDGFTFNWTNLIDTTGSLLDNMILAKIRALRTDP